MSDIYFAAVEEQWPNIRALYMTYRRKKPIILYDLQDKKIYTYPYKEFKAELNNKEQELLEKAYKLASTIGEAVVFVRDNAARKLVSFTMSIDTPTLH